MKYRARPTQTQSFFYGARNIEKVKVDDRRRKHSNSGDIGINLSEVIDPEVYFNKNKRKVYLKNVVDNYFIGPNATTRQVKESKMDTIRNSQKTLKRKDVFSSEGSRGRVSSNTPLKLSLQPPQPKANMFNLSSVQTSQALPIISQLGFIKRPISQHKSQRSPKMKQQRQESVFNDSTRSLYDSKIFNQELDQTTRSFRSGSNMVRKNKLRVFDKESQQLLQREKMIKKMGYQMLWQGTDRQNIIQYPGFRTLRELCYSQIEDKKGDEPLFLIFPKDYYHSLFTNNCQQLLDITISMAKIIAKGKGIVSNNQIHINNVVKIEEKRFKLYDWGCSAIKESLKVRERTFEKCHLPLCKYQQKWMVTPEYLAPQMLRAIELESYEHLWGQQGGISACDVWSLGCLIFEMVTLIPIWQPYHCAIKGISHTKRGILGNKLHTAQSILAKHKTLKSLVLRRLKQHLHALNITLHPKLLTLIPLLLSPDPAQRPSPSQIISFLS